MRCPNCKETNHEPGARFCIVCGTPLVADDELHFIPAAVVPIVGYLILTNIQNLLTIVLEGLLVILLLVADFGTLETIFSD